MRGRRLEVAAPIPTVGRDFSDAYDATAPFCPEYTE